MKKHSSIFHNGVEDKPVMRFNIEIISIKRYKDLDEDGRQNLIEWINEQKVAIAYFENRLLKP